MTARFNLLPSFILFIIILAGCRQNPDHRNPVAISPVDLVNPLMGTASSYEFSHGNTYPSVSLPWGMECWTPQTGEMGNGWVYQYNAKKIQGIRHTHQPSPWMGDYGAYSFMAITGTLRVKGGERASAFSHDDETSTPYYYQVKLQDYNVNAEVSSKERAAMLRFTFPAGDSSYIIFDGFNMGSFVKYIPGENRLEGYVTNNRGGVPANFRQYFSGTLSERPVEYGCWNDSTLESGRTEMLSDHAGAYFRFKTNTDHQVVISIGSSYISVAQARRNLSSEIGNKSFDNIKEEGKETWNRHLDRIAVEGGTPDQQKVFYTCLYRALQFPRIFYEYNSTGTMVHYSPFDGGIHKGPMFADDGFWDTFRAGFPLFALLYPDKDSQMMQWLINAYDEGGWLPIWPSPGYRKVMIGSHSASLLADAMAKGITGFDSLKALEGAVKDATEVPPDFAPGRDGGQYYNELGYCPYPEIHESTAKTLEYCYDDFCIRQMARKLGKEKIADEFYKRAFNYRNVFDKTRLLMQGRKKDGSFLREFSPLAWGGPFTEGNAWHYTWSVFHDPQGLINMMGGDSVFTTMLDSVFSQPAVADKGTYPVVIHEIAEMVKGGMGEYAHGNEPIQHMIYLYNYAGQPWKAQYWLREVMKKLYNPGPQGYCGDEDTGQTSAWYVFTAMGFYPVCPGVPQYVIGTPLFDKVTIHLENGKDFTISAENNSDADRYIKSARLNNEEYTKNWISHEAILKGGEMHFVMDSIPDHERGINPEDRPYSLSNEMKK